MKRIIFLITIAIFSISCTNMPNRENQRKEETYILIKGINYTEQGRIREALTEFKKVYEINPENIQGLKNLGLAYLKLDKLDKGERYLKEVLELDKTNVDALYNLGILYNEKEDYDKSIKYLNQILVEDENYDIVKARAYVNYRLGNYQKSYNEFQKLFKYNRDRYEITVLETYLKVLGNLERYRDSYDFLLDQYKKGKKDLNIVVLFSNYLKMMGNYDKAISILKEFGVDSSFSYRILYELSRAFLEKGELDKANQYFSLISQDDRMNYEVLKLELEIYEKQGKKEKADKIRKILNEIEKRK
ncbi:MAG: tetratricopeptide repeat protein [Fusobacteriota bacterium]